MSFLVQGLWRFGGSEMMARGKAAGVLSSSCLCWGANHRWTIVAPGLGGTGDGGMVLVRIVARSDWRWGISYLLHFDRLYSFGTALLKDAISCIKHEGRTTNQ